MHSKMATVHTFALGPLANFGTEGLGGGAFLGGGGVLFVWTWKWGTGSCSDVVTGLQRGRKRVVMSSLHCWLPCIVFKSNYRYCINFPTCILMCMKTCPTNILNTMCHTTLTSGPCIVHLVGGLAGFSGFTGGLPELLMAPLGWVPKYVFLSSAVGLTKASTMES